MNRFPTRKNRFGRPPRFSFNFNFNFLIVTAFEGQNINDQDAMFEVFYKTKFFFFIFT